MLGALLGRAGGLGTGLYGRPLAGAGAVERNVVELGEREAVARSDFSYLDEERMRRARNMMGNMVFAVDKKHGLRDSRTYNQLVRRVANQLA